MAQVILQPCAGDIARQHYEDTILKRVPLARLRPHLSSADFEALQRLYPDGSALVWGVEPGPGNATKWLRVSPGDVVFFSGKGRVHATGIVRYKCVSQAVSRDLWPDSEGRVWERLYFVDELVSRDIPYSTFNAAAGYEPGNVIQGFNVLGPEHSKRILAALGLDGGQSITVEEYRAADQELLALDRVVEAFARTEQAFLRRYLFGDRAVGECGICGRHFPVELLVAAHIKPRAHCSDVERNDYGRNIAPMCLFGCDGLFERGYIAVSSGGIVVSEEMLEAATETVRAYLDYLQDRECGYWDGREGYFGWHATHHGFA